MEVNKISYEGSKWYIKIWRTRWYIYAVFLHLLNFININMWIDLLLKKGISKAKKKSLRNDWRAIIHHVELSKMYKYSSKVRYERED